MPSAWPSGGFGVDLVRVAKQYVAAVGHAPRLDARVAELVDAPDLGSGAFGREGSTPFARTIFKQTPTLLSMSSRPWPHGQFIVDLD